MQAMQAMQAGDVFDMSQMRAALCVPVGPPPSPRMLLHCSNGVANSGTDYDALGSLAPRLYAYASSLSDGSSGHVPPPATSTASTTTATRATVSPSTRDLQQALVRAMKDTMRLAPETPLYPAVPGWTHRRALTSLWHELETATRALAPPRRSAQDLEAAVCVLMAGALYKRGELKTASSAVRATRCS